ncbi:MAG: NDP-sugar synthase [Thermodesulfobacteriota bacterium]|nr:MAG: NDP-sugar synthase [Thermodesulfobacteriota bacterium]
MKAIILAAGFGIRMKPLSDRCPKPLLPVLGRPIIDYTISRLKTFGVKAIGVNICHLADKMQKYLGNGSRWGVDITLSREQEILGTGGGMGGFRSFLLGEEAFLVNNGDVLSTIALDGLVTAHAEHKPMVTMALCDYRPKNNVSLSLDNTIVDFLGRLKKFKPGIDRKLTFTGVSMVSEEVLNIIPPGIPSNIIDIYLELIKRKPGSINGYVVSGDDWMDIGTPSAYLGVHKDILLGQRLPLFIDEMLDGSVYKGVGTRIEPGARLEGFVSLGNNCLVEREAFLKNCVVWDNTLVKAGASFDNGVIDGDWQYSLPV